MIALLGVGSYAIAGGGTKNFKGSPMNGYEENPDVSTVATGSFEAELSDDGDSLALRAQLLGARGDRHAGSRPLREAAVNGGISFCALRDRWQPRSPRPDTPACPQPERHRRR